MEVIIKTIPYERMRYETSGDWWWHKGHDILYIRVSEMGDWKSEMAVAFHELFEALACKARGITEQAVDDFDTTWKESEGIDEPGNDPKAPYHREHSLAEACERILVDALGVKWAEHNERVLALGSEEQ